MFPEPVFRKAVQTMQKTLVIGSTVVDVLIRVDHLPSSEEDINPKSQKLTLGGCAYNVSNVLRQMNAPYELFSPVGTGLFGDFVRTRLQEKGIIPSLNPKEENGCCYCLVDSAGDRTFMAVHGAEYHFYQAWFESLNMADFDSIYVCGLEIEEETGACIIDFLKKCTDQTVYFAPGARILSISSERMEQMLDLNPIVHLNEREASAYLHSAEDIRELAEKLYERTGNTVIITRGAKGAVCRSKEGYLESAAARAVQKDGTGAGDSHLAAFIASQKMDLTIANSMRIATLFSAAVVETEGAALNDETAAEILKQM